METHRISEEQKGARLEPTLVESDADPFAEDVTPIFGRDATGPDEEQAGGAIAGRYLLKGRIGRGQLGEIHEAVDLRLSEAGMEDHYVAIELVTLGRGQADVRRKLTNEFLSLLTISHPNIARILDFGVDGTTTFFTTELLEGVSLRSILDGDPTDALTEGELLAVIRGVSEGLSYLHARGVVHGNLGPESVFITTGYEVKIVDLAAVRLARAKEGSTEVRFGGSVPLDVQDDVFGLACVTYEWLTNEHPFGNVSSFEAFRSELKPERIKGLPRPQWKALARALELQPEARTRTVEEFASEFGVQGDETLLAESERAGRRGWLRPVLWLGALAGALALARPYYEDLGGALAAVQAALRSGADALPSLMGEAEPVPTPPEPAPAPSEPNAAAPATDASLYPYPASSAARAADDPAAQASPVEPPAPAVASEADPQPSTMALPTSPTLVPDPVGAAAEPAEPAESADAARPPGGMAQAAAPAITAPVEPPVEPTSLAFRFAAESLSVTEGDNVAAIVVNRVGGADAEASLVWWTSAGTATADDDYADFGARTETFAAGQESLTIFVPLVSDALAEDTESFHVSLRWETAPVELVQTLEVVVLDDDA